MAIQITTDRADLIAEAVRAQSIVLRALHEATGPAWLDIDMSMSQLRAIFILMRAGAMPIGELGAALRIGKPAASILVDGLVASRLVARAEDRLDRRRTIASLTTEGIALVAHLRQSQQDKLSQWMEQLSDDDLTTLAQGMNALADVTLDESSHHAREHCAAGEQQAPIRPRPSIVSRDPTVS